jgi:DNA-binding transcriptional regulator YiaG
MKTSNLFKQEVAKVPIDVKLELDLSFAIADKIDAILKRIGMSQKEFAKKMNKTEAEVSRWLSGTHNFTIKTIAKITSVLGEKIIVIP